MFIIYLCFYVYIYVYMYCSVTAVINLQARPLGKDLDASSVFFYPNDTKVKKEQQEENYSPIPNVSRVCKEKPLKGVSKVQKKDCFKKCF